MISEINSQIENNISPEIFEHFQKSKRSYNTFEYFFKFILNDTDAYKVNFNDKKVEKKTKDELEKYFTIKEDNDDENNIIDNKKNINKNNLASVIKWFMILVLFSEKYKDNKIKENKKNWINYLNVEDLWNEDIKKDSKFSRDLNDLKKFNIQMNEIVWLNDYLVEDENEEENIKEIKDYINNKNVKPAKDKYNNIQVDDSEDSYDSKSDEESEDTGNNGEEDDEGD